ncbi:hypothetical protein D3C84_907390 [compost metagenome]
MSVQPGKQRRVAGLLHVQAADVVTPHQKAGRTAGAADLLHGRQRQAEAAAMAVEMHAQRAAPAEGSHDIEWVVALVVDAVDQLGQRTAGDAADVGEHAGIVGPGGGCGGNCDCKTVHGILRLGVGWISRPGRC